MTDTKNAKELNLQGLSEGTLRQMYAVLTVLRDTYRELEVAETFADEVFLEGPTYSTPPPLELLPFKKFIKKGIKKDIVLKTIAYAGYGTGILKPPISVPFPNPEWLPTLVSPQGLDDLLESLKATLQLHGKSELGYADHTLHFMGEEILIPPDTNQDDLCKVVFANKESVTREWSWDEILEKWGEEYGSYTRKDWRKVYEAKREVNQKISSKIGVSDLLIGTTHIVLVNPKYTKV